MVLNKKPLRRRSLKTNYSRLKKKISQKSKYKWKSILKFVIYIGIFFVFFTALLLMVLYFKYIKDLPSTKELEDLNIAESSIIYDRNWDELYKIFKEKRTYVNYENISQNMVNALVSWEDKRYWTNPWVDLIGITRAGLYYILWKSDGWVKGTSTLTQQLIRNTIIKNERSVERKIKEIYLAYKLTANLSKEKILELYLNKISFWHNAFGIEEAAKTFFGKNAKDLWILESSILASLPKGPTYYSPYNHPDRLIGYPYIYKKNTETQWNNNPDEPESEEIKILSPKDLIEYSSQVQYFTDYISSLKANRLADDRTLICNINQKYLKKAFKIDDDGCSVLWYSDLLNFLNSIKIDTGEYYIEYQTGRKDFILQRMLEDNYISFEKYQASIITAIGFKFTQRQEAINAPHFVFYVKEYLEDKFGKDIVSVGWLKIYTSLDPQLQKKAEELVEKYGSINETKFAAKNAALVSLDNRTWEVLAMVWGRNYFDTENKGNVNVITSAIQPWSTFKPFVYSLWIANQKIWSKTPIYDVKTTFPWNYAPSNFDGKFMGKMNLSTALNNSRNIPAIKMFYMAGGESNIVNFMQKIWVKSLKHHGQYGAPLALGTWEMTPLELASAYSVFANLWIKKDIIPVTKIVDSKGNIIEEHKQNIWEEVMSPWQAYIMNSMLSDSSTRPTFWNTYLTINGRKVAAKTGTSTKQYNINGRKSIYPRNLWTIWYTPQITTVVWAWNTDGTQLNYKWNGLEWAAPIWRDFMNEAHKNIPAESWPRPSSVKEMNISSISGKLPNPEGNGDDFLVSSLFLKSNIPSQVDNSYKNIQIDLLCQGKVTEETPQSAIWKGFLLELHSINPENIQWEKWVQEWAKGEDFKTLYGNIANLTTQLPTNICERSSWAANVDIKTTLENNEILTPGENTVEIWYKSNKSIQKIQIFINDSLSQEIDTQNQTSSTYTIKLFIPASGLWHENIVKIRTLDSDYYSNEIIRNIQVAGKDITPPEINILNPSDGNISIYSSDFFNFRALIVERSNLKVDLKIDDIVVQEGLTTNNIKYWVNQNEKLSVWSHTLEIIATDKYNNSSSKKININILSE